jgi:glycosyltransferase involved in cell wall biosynthesis
VRVAVHTPDTVGERMAGPGIRAWHLATELAKHHPTTLVAKREGAIPAPAEFRIVTHGSRDAAQVLRAADVVVGQPARGFRRLRRGQRVVYDLFDPVLLELREMYGRSPSMRQRIHLEAERWRLRRALADGDLLMVAFAKQRELYAEATAPVVEVPFGVDRSPLAVDGENQPPTANRQPPTVIWGGGTWEWLDPRTAVDAVIAANEAGVACRLLFLGRSRPNRHMIERRREDRLDQLLRHGAPYVEANAEWVPYRERLAWLRRSKIAIMLHRPTAEAPYSIRTRLFDAIAAAVPIITTEEGFAAELVAAEGLGLIVPPGDSGAAADAVIRLLRDDALYARCVSNLARVRPRFAWDAVVRPLIDVLTEWQKQAD